MSRGISTLLKAAVSRLTRAHMWKLVEFPSVYATGTTPLRFTDFPRPFVYSAKTWQPLGGMETTGLAENLRIEAPVATIRLPSLDGALQAKFLADQFRGTKCWITVIVQEPATSIVDASQLWQTRYTCGAEADDQDGVIITLTSADAAEGTEVPRRQVSEIGCQEDYMLGGCWYRNHRTYQLVANGGLVVGSHQTAQFPTCSKRLEDVGQDPGCRSHFPPLLNPAWVLGGTQPRTLKQPMPYGAFPGETPGLVIA